METLALMIHHDVLHTFALSVLLGIGVSIVIIITICLIFPINPRK
jgi:hypothetical protein